MARPHRPVRGSVYEKRRVSGSAAPPAPPAAGLSSAEARRLGARIDSTQDRYRVTAIRLIEGRSCGLLLADSLTGGAHMVATADEWHRLQAEQA
jgi:hypothetical protein